MTADHPWLSAAEAGTVLRGAREDAGLTQEQVAAALGVDKSYVSKLESGLHHAGRSKYFPRLVQVLGLGAGQVRRLNPGAAVGVGVGRLPGHTLPGGRPPPVAPVVSPIPLPLAVPDELQRVIDAHGAAYPELHDETTLRILTAPRNFGGAEHGPQTEADWFEYFLLTRRFLR